MIFFKFSQIVWFYAWNLRTLFTYLDIWNWLQVALCRYLLAASQTPLTSRASFTLDVLSSLALLVSYFLHLFRFYLSLSSMSLSSSLSFSFHHHVSSISTQLSSSSFTPSISQRPDLILVPRPLTALVLEPSLRSSLTASPYLPVLEVEARDKTHTTI